MTELHENKNRNPFLTALLIPFSLVYGTIVHVRNKLFDTGILPSVKFPFPVISVGNITAGGTGKTPHVEHIVSILKDDYRVAVLSRGYRRRSSGFVIADTSSEVSDIGDEPLQIKKKYPEAVVAVSASRVKGIRKLLSHDEDIQAVVLDDAFQHRWVKAGMSVLLVDYNRPVTSDRLLPAGMLRESISSKTRASIVIVTKCPPRMTPIERRIIRKDLDLYPWQSLYFTAFSYGHPLPVFSEGRTFPDKGASNKPGPAILMVTGIASPAILRDYLNGISGDITQMIFPDHHRYTRRDIQRIEKAWVSMESSEKFIITTEKDAMRFREIPGIEAGLKMNMYYIPVTITFLERNSSKFKKQILDYVRKNKGDNIISQK